MRQTIALVEEMLGLLVTIVGERTVPGVGLVTHDDRIKKEIMQQLCIKPLSHSELNKTLPDDVNHETGLERVIDDIAIFKKPENTGRVLLLLLIFISCGMASPKTMKNHESFWRSELVVGKNP